MTLRRDFDSPVTIQQINEDKDFGKLQKQFEKYKTTVSEQFQCLSCFSDTYSGQNLSRVVRDSVNQFINQAKQSKEIIIRQPKNGEYGWIVQLHGKIYWNEYKYDEKHEGLVATIIGEFIETFELGKQLTWIAELDGKPVGSVLCARVSDDTAKLRLLLVDSKGRGLKIGEKLVETCVKFAESVGYKNIVLWTTNLHTAARKVYEKFGFQLVNTEVTSRFGQDALEFQDWRKEFQVNKLDGESPTLQLVESYETDVDKLKYEYAEYRGRVNERLEEILQLCNSIELRDDLATSIKMWSTWFTDDDHCEVILRKPRHSEYGWIIRTHGKQYWEEFRWNVEYEGLVAKIVGEFVDRFEEGKSQAWIAEMNREPVGCIVCTKDDEITAKLSLLLVDKKAKGLKIDEKLIEACINFAVDAGYHKLSVWTYDVLADTRKIYKEKGFYLVNSHPQHSFGHELIAQIWNKHLKEI